jgi:hypothetical protein
MPLVFLMPVVAATVLSSGVETEGHSQFLGGRVLVFLTGQIELVVGPDGNLQTQLRWQGNGPLLLQERSGQQAQLMRRNLILEWEQWLPLF